MSATISIIGTKVQERSNGDIPSPTLTLVVSSNITPKKSKGNEIKEKSIDNTIILDEAIDMTKWDLANPSFEKIVILQGILVRKKKQEEMR